LRTLPSLTSTTRAVLPDSGDCIANDGHVKKSYGDVDRAFEHINSRRGLLHISDCEITFSTFKSNSRAVLPYSSGLIVDSGHIEESYSDVNQSLERLASERSLGWQSDGGSVVLGGLNRPLVLVATDEDGKRR
jgi:hypothetical protein